MKLPETYIFSTKLNCISFTEVIDQIRLAIANKSKLFLFPMNVHILVELSKNIRFRYFHNRDGVIFTDGLPLVWLSYLTSNKIPERISGTSLVDKILKVFKHIYMIGPDNETFAIIKKKYQFNNEQMLAGYCSPPYADEWEEKINKQIIENINQSKAEIVLVGVGPLKQEKWILKYASKTNAKIFIAVGSAFEIISGKRPRAPVWMQNSGLEWLWRMILEPKRLIPRYIKDMFRLFYLMFQFVVAKITF